MTAKRALVVDDSKSARAFLARVLQRYALEVEGVESAEQAIEYLAHQRPDVIFMDHLMPGMDGFQAVQAIKNDPRTATIPIMMYTSQEGELYISQARALGAIGVLPKQIRHADLAKALQQLRLIDQVPQDAELPTVRIEALPTDAEPPPDMTVERRGPNRPNAPALAPDLRAVFEAMLAHHNRDLRRFVVDNMETHADRIVGDVRMLLQDETVTPHLRWPVRAGLVAAAIAAAGLLFALLWWRERTASEVLAAELSGARAQLTSTQSTVDALRSAQAPEGAPAAPTAEAVSQMSLQVPFGEAALGGQRVEPLQNLLAQLSSSGFHGSVQIRSFPGRFCLSQGSGDTLALAAPETLYSKCDQVGNLRDSGSEPRESLAFANMLSSARKSAAGAFDIQVTSGGATETVTPYPIVTDSLTAGDWNQAAAANNRVEVRWQASH